MLNRSGAEAVIRSIQQRADKSPRIKIMRRHSEELMRQLAGASGQQTASTPVHRSTQRGASGSHRGRLGHFTLFGQDLS